MNMEELILKAIENFTVSIKKIYEDKFAELTKRENDLIDQTRLVRIAEQRMREMDEREKHLVEREAFVEKEKQMDRERKLILDAKEKEVNEKTLHAQNILKSIGG